MRSRPAGTWAIAASTAVFVLSFAALLGPAASTAWAQPMVQVFTFTPDHIEIDVPSTISVTAEVENITQTSVTSVTVQLFRLNDDGSKTKLCQLKNLGAAKGVHTLFTGIYVCTQNLTEALTDTIKLRVDLDAVLANKQPWHDESEIRDLRVGKLASTTATTVLPGAGFNVTVPPQAAATFVSGNRGKPSDVQNPPGKSIAAVLHVTVEESLEGLETEGLSQPLGFEVATPGVPDGEVVVAREVVIETITTVPINSSCPPEAPTAGTDGVSIRFCVGSATPQLLPVAIAATVNGTIVTGQSPLPGATSSGPYAFVTENGSGYATGTVTENGIAQAGVVVSNSTNTFVAVTNASGQYTLFVDAGPLSSPGFTVNAFHPLRGSVGSKAGSITVEGATVTANIAITAPSASVNPRPGIRNAGFERGDLSNWVTTGNVSVVKQFATIAYTPSGTVCPTTKNVKRPAGAGGVNYSVCSPNTSAGPVTIVPVPPATGKGDNGKWVAVLSTAGASDGSSLAQKFTVPAGAQKLRIDYNYVTEEAPEFALIGPFNDSFRILVTPEGQNPLTPAGFPVTVDTTGFTFIGNCQFTGGDTTCSQSNWRTAEIDLSQYAGTATPIELKFTVVNEGDGDYETRVYIDNIHFKQLWIDVKVVAGANPSITTQPAATLTLGATSGTGVVATTSAGAFTAANVDGHIKVGASDAIIKTVNSSTSATVDILTAFSATSYASGGWSLVVDRVRANILSTNEVLSQAGLNVNLRQVRTLNSATYLDVNVQHTTPTPNNCIVNNTIVVGVDPAGTALQNLQESAEEFGVMTDSTNMRSLTDYNVYYVKSATPPAGIGTVKGWTASFGDFCGDVISTNTGTLITDAGTAGTMPHEFSHALIRSVTPSALQHQVTSTVYSYSPSPDSGVVQSGQSLAIHCGALTELTTPKCSASDEATRLLHTPLLDP